ncbi:hypothetical protein LR48_Vigan04g179500 [Vigna angularis]|uniref:Uncharacterized protein n=1 Tax=Phaseolus angularis TaxID=3914 RepID=A0A0L9UGB5_PHAAN|nr:hypothetical protein LR48_Vigan04g179500 [Vigna angularis]
MAAVIFTDRHWFLNRGIFRRGKKRWTLCLGFETGHIMIRLGLGSNIRNRFTPFTASEKKASGFASATSIAASASASAITAASVASPPPPPHPLHSPPRPPRPPRPPHPPPPQGPHPRAVLLRYRASIPAFSSLSLPPPPPQSSLPPSLLLLLRRALRIRHCHADILLQPPHLIGDCPLLCRALLFLRRRRLRDASPSSSSRALYGNGGRSGAGSAVVWFSCGRFVGVRKKRQWNGGREESKSERRREPGREARARGGESEGRGGKPRDRGGREGEPGEGRREGGRENQGRRECGGS